MPVLGVGLGLFLAAFAIHVVVWRAARPRATGQWLIALLVATILAGAAGLVAAQAAFPAMRAWLPGSAGAWTEATLLALALSAAYVLSYPAIEVASPTLVMIQIVAEAGAQGIPRDAFHRRLGDEVLVLPRIEDLLREGFAVAEDGRYALTGKGRAMARAFLLWRRTLKLGKGG